MINSFCFQSKEKTATGENINSYWSDIQETHRNPEWSYKFKYKENSFTWSRAGGQAVIGNLCCLSTGLEAMK